MDLGLGGRTAIVCGASSGLGLASAEALAEEGARVVMFARRGDVLEREAERIGGIAVVGDVREPDDLARAVDTAVEAGGGIDILVPNSGGPPGAKAVRDRRRSRCRKRSTCCCFRSCGSSSCRCRTCWRATRAGSS